MTEIDARKEALDIAFEYDGIEGDHHRAWVIDQMVRALTGSDYPAWVADFKAGEDGPGKLFLGCETYEYLDYLEPWLRSWGAPSVTRVAKKPSPRVSYTTLEGRLDTSQREIKAKTQYWDSR